jgi:hypothetical protein
MSSTQHKHQQQQDPQIVSCGECGEKPKKGVTFKVCACGEPYCCNACQSKAWAEHKGPCKIKRKEIKIAKAEEAAAAALATERGSGSGSGLRDMGSIMAALKLPPPQQQPDDGMQLWNACFHDRFEDLKMMLQQHGLYLNLAEPQSGVTAACLSAQQGSDRCLSLLAKHGADLSKAANNGFAPIHAACQGGKYVCAEVLLDNGVDADLHTSDELGVTPSMNASQCGQVKILALLLDRGSDPDLGDCYGYTPAHYACKYGHLKVLELLVKRGADVNKKDVNGHTPLDIARTFKQRECVDLLISNGARGMDMKDLPTVSEAQKVCAAASFSALSVPVRSFTLMMYHSNTLIGPYGRCYQ